MRASPFCPVWRNSSLTCLPIAGQWSPAPPSASLSVRLAAGGIPLPSRLVAAEHVTRGKPHPEPFLAGAALLGVSPSDCVVFEDSASGAIAGRAAGCIVVATTFSHRAESLEAADYIVRDLAGVSVAVNGEMLALEFTPLERA